MNWGQIVGWNVRRLRKARSLTQEQLALEAGLDLTYVGDIERGQRNPTVDVLARIAGALGCHPRDLLADSNAAD